MSRALQPSHSCVATGEAAGKASLWVSEGGLFPSLPGRFVKIRKYPWVFIT